MSVEFKTIDGKIAVFVLRDNDLDYFESAYFDVFNAKYNNLLDLYGTFRLYDNHLRYLMDLLEIDKSKPKAIQDLLKVVKHCIDNAVTLKVIGE